ncbi:MAG TPA: protein kinase, partial [Pyrinomonadaceae bacterium]
PNNLTLLAGILRENGYQARIAKSGARALEMIAFQAPELVLLDIEMPEMDGYEVCRRLKANQSLQAFPVIFISALGETGDKVKGFEVGCVDYVTKPFQDEEVLARVATQLEIYRLRRDLERRNLELARRNAELVEAHERTNRVFSALTETLPGKVLDNKYRLDLKIGTGGFGVVYRATHLTLERPVAVKVFRPTPGNDSPDALERFRREGVAASKFVHPNAVEVYDFGISSNGIAYIVMELLRGFTLSETLSSKGVLPLERAVEIILPVCAALAEAHAAGVVHRDVKPANIFLHQTKHGEVVKLVDFGIAKQTRLANENGFDAPDTGYVLGTSDYMAPERFLSGACDGQVDVYSLGVMFYRMLVGQMPFKSDSPKARLLDEAIPIGNFDSSIPPEIQILLANMLSREPSARPTAAQLSEKLMHLSETFETV